MNPELTELLEFLPCSTPDRWIENALDNQRLLLIDHANCEKKAASTALNLMYRYVGNYSLLQKMSRLAREELRHFEQVLALLKERGIEYVQLSASRYAGQLHAEARKEEPGKLVDSLLIGALIEARSCERFARLAPYLDKKLGDFYRGLLKSESRHFGDYLRLARSEASDAEIELRLKDIAQREAALILGSDSNFRFHSGPVAA